MFFVNLFEKVGIYLNNSFEKLGRYYIFLASIFRWSLKSPRRIRLLFSYVEKIGVNSVPIITLTSMAVGMIFALQITQIMRIFRAEILVGATVAMTLGRELAPIMTTLMLIAKNGSAMAAELGTMRVTEQIDAMETMAVNPIHYLVVPVVFASILVFPVLTAISNLVGVFGTYIVAVKFLGVDSAGFFDRMYWLVDPVDIYSGLIKSAVMGFIVSSICCYCGYYTKNGAKGVGEATTTAVVTSSVSILIADYIMADIMIKTLFR